MKPVNYVGLLSDVIDSLPQNRRLREANIYTSIDGDLVIDVFVFESMHERRDDQKFDVGQNEARVEKLLHHFERYCRMKLEIEQNDNEAVQKTLPDAFDDLFRTTNECDAFLKFLSGCDASYVRNTSYKDIISHFNMVEESSRSDCVKVTLEEKFGLNSAAQGKKEDGASGAAGNWIGAFEEDEFDDGSVFAMEHHVVDEDKSFILTIVREANEHDDIFSRTVKHLSRVGIDILKSTLVRVENFNHTNFLILTFSVRPTFCHLPEVTLLGDSPTNTATTATLYDSAVNSALCKEIGRLVYLDPSVLLWVKTHTDALLFDAELVLCLCKLVHCLLADEKPLIFTQFNMDRFMGQYPAIIRLLLVLFHTKFSAS